MKELIEDSDAQYRLPFQNREPGFSLTVNMAPITKQGYNFDNLIYKQEEVS